MFRHLSCVFTKSVRHRLSPPLRYSFCTISHSLAENEVTYARIPSGHTIPLPRGSIAPINPQNIALFGEGALDQYFKGNTPQDLQANKSQNVYKRYRPGLLSNYFGRWIAINEMGAMFLANTEEFVRKSASLLFPNEEYHVDCIGCEILRAAYMDGDKSTNNIETLQYNQAIPNGKFSTVFENQFLVRAKYSFDGQNFEDVVMKYDPGATHVGVPEEVLSDLPLGVTLTRGENLYYYSPSAEPVKVRSYINNYVQIAGLVTKTTFIVARVWLLGFPIISRYVNTLDVTSDEPVLMKPLTGQNDDL